MEWLFTGLAGIGIIFFLLSFFAVDHEKELKEDVEQLSLQVMGDVFEIKKRLSYLEEELLSNQPSAVHKKHGKSSHDLMKEAHDLFEQGWDVMSISKKMKLNPDEVKYLLARTQ